MRMNFYYGRHLSPSMNSWEHDFNFSAAFSTDKNHTILGSNGVSIVGSSWGGHLGASYGSAWGASRRTRPPSRNMEFVWR